MHFTFNQTVGQFLVVFPVDVEDRIGKEKVINAFAVIQFFDVFHYRYGVQQTDAGTLNVGITAVNTSVGTASFCLDVQHPAFIKIEMSRVRLNMKS